MTILGNNPANRLIEVVAGTTSLISDSSSVQSNGPLAPLAGSDILGNTTETSDHTGGSSAALLAQPLDLLQAVPLQTGDLAASSAGSDGLAAMTTLAHAGDVVDNLDIVADLLNPAASGSDTAPLQLAGEGALLQPVLDTANAAVAELHAEIVGLGSELGLGQTAADITKFGESLGPVALGATPASDGHTNLVTDLLNLPSDVLAGNIGDSVSHLSADLTQGLSHLFVVKDDLIFGTTDPTNPVPELLASVGHDLQSLPILDIGNGNGGLLDGVVGHLVDSSSHHLIDVDVGPAGPDGLPLNVLASPQAGDSHTLEVNAIDVAPGGPVLADLGVLTGGQLLDLPGGSGADALVGDLLGAVGGGAPADLLAVTGSAESGADLPAIDVAHGLLGGLTDHGLLNGTHVI